LFSLTLKISFSAFFWNSVHPVFLNMVSLKRHHSLTKEWPGEDQLVNECLLKSLPLKGGVTSSSQTPPGLVSKHVKVLERTKVWTWALMGPETNIDCAGKGQQKFT
jgi:hypothetical protein